MNEDDLEIQNIYNNYDFTYTSKDINYINDSYFNSFGYKPFDDTTLYDSNLKNVEIRSDDLTKYENFSNEAYRDENYQIENSIVERVNNTQVRITTTDEEMIFAFRGSEVRIDEGYKDFLDDSSSRPKLISSLNWNGVDGDSDGIIHNGFNNYVDSIYNLLVGKYISKDITKSITIVGHSIGGIASIIFGYRLYLDFKQQNIDIKIKGIYAFGSPKGLFIPSRMVENIKIINVLNKYDAIGYIYPIFGDYQGTKIILDGLNKDNNFEIIYKDQLTPYLGINIGTSIKLFETLIDGDKSYFSFLNDYYEPIKNAGFIYDMLDKKYSGIFLNSLRSSNDTIIKFYKYVNDANTKLNSFIFDTKSKTGIFKYEMLSYSLQLAIFSNNLQSTYQAHTNYKDFLNNIDDYLLISMNNLGYNQIPTPIDISNLYYLNSYFLKSSIKKNKSVNKKSKNIKILGYISNYKDNMRGSLVVF